MKTITINTYSFEELSPKAKEKARAWFREGMEFDSEFTIEDAKQGFAFMGFDVSNVYFSGFSSQGDGACFEGSWSPAKVDATKLKGHAPIDKELHRLADIFAKLSAQIPSASFTVKHSGHYYHQYCTVFDFAYDDCENPSESALPEFEKQAIDAARDCMAWLYRTLEKDYDWQNANEQVDENMRANDYAFTAQGSRSTIL